MIARLKSWLKRKRPETRFYDSFEAAADGTSSYLDPDIVEVVVTKTKRLRKVHPTFLDRQQIQNHFAIDQFCQQANSKQVTIVDWGGAAGASYFYLRTLFTPRIREWHVVETPIMVAGAAPLADNVLRFSTTTADIGFGETDGFLWAQGILNFIDRPLQQFSDQLQKNYKGIYISRTSFTESEDQLIYRFEAPLQNHGPGPLTGIKSKVTSYPFTVVSWPRLQLMLEREGYIMASLFDEGEERLNDQVIPVRGLLAFKK